MRNDIASKACFGKQIIKGLFVLALAMSVVMAMAGCKNKKPASQGGTSQMPEATSEDMTETSEGTSVGMANPWVGCTQDDVEAALGITIKFPEGYESAKFLALLEQTEDGQEIDEETRWANALYEIYFDYDGLMFCYRLKKTEELEDISGLYYDWDKTFDFVFMGHDCKQYRSIADGIYCDLMQWYDENKGVTYSLSVQDDDLDGFDIEGVAGMMVTK